MELLTRLRTWGPPLLAVAFATVGGTGCGKMAPNDECNAGESHGDAGAPASREADAPSGAPANQRQSGASLIAVTLSGADANHIWSVEAMYGSFDEPLVFVAAGSQGAGIVAKEEISIRVSAAAFADESPVVLRLVTPDGAPAEKVTISPGEQVVLHLRGHGLGRAGTYRAALDVGGKEPRGYSLRIKSASPYAPLGLQAAEIVATRDDLPIFGRRSITRVIQVDSAAMDDHRYHVLVKPAEHPSPNAEPLPACGIVARAIGRSDRIALEMPPLEAGRYEGVVEVQGEPIKVQLTLKNPAVIVFLLVALGAVVALFVRWLVGHLVTIEQNENKIAAWERAAGKHLSKWDDLQVRQTARRARGSNQMLGLDDVADILKESAPVERAEPRTIEKALGSSTLPEAVKAPIRLELLRLLYLSSREDADEINRGLADLSQRALSGFRPDLLDWLKNLHERIGRWKADEILPALNRHDRVQDPAGSKLVMAALHLLEMLVKDAEKLIGKGLDPSEPHSRFLAHIGPILEDLAGWVKGTAPLPKPSIRNILDCVYKPAERPKTIALASPMPVAGLRIQARSAVPEAELQAHDEIIFEIVDEKNASLGKGCAIRWEVDGQSIRGGSKLTYVFQSWSVLSLKRKHRAKTVLAYVGGGNDPSSVIRSEHPIRPAWSIAFSRRLAASAAKLSATVVGVLVASAVAVTLYWAGKPFGTSTDYITLFTAGLGVEVGVVGVGGKLVSTIVGYLTKQSDCPAQA